MIASDYKQKINKKPAGFTLLEIMIVIAIIAILSTVSIISFEPIKKNANMSASGDELLSTVNLAREYALQGKMPNGRTSICGYGFEFTSATQYRIFYYYDNTATTDSNYCKVQGNFIKTSANARELKSGITLASPAIGSSTIYFSIPRADLVFSAPVNYNIVYTSTSLQKTITVNSAGLIEMH